MFTRAGMLSRINIIYEQWRSLLLNVQIFCGEKVSIKRRREY